MKSSRPDSARHNRLRNGLQPSVNGNPENAESIVKALEQFGFGSLGLTPEELLTPSQVIQLGYPPRRIDLLTSIAGVDFAACNPEKTTVVPDIDRLSVDFIDLVNLKKINWPRAGIRTWPTWINLK